jgi:ectoine hydroxylase-related dioxygenase (phytanoyl-CoA dioxygenase family)
VKEGFTFFPERLAPQALDELRSAMTQLAESHALDRSGDLNVADPHRRDVRFCQHLLVNGFLVDSVRSLLAPQVVLRRSSAIFAFPGAQKAAAWHTDQRYLVWPRPPLFTEPRLLTVLVYLEDADDETGPLFVRPGSHRLLVEPESDDRQFPDQVVLRPQAGETVFLDSAIWHRPGGNNNQHRVRQVLALSFVPIFYRRPPSIPDADSIGFQQLVEDACARGDEALLEVLGVIGDVA